MNTKHTPGPWTAIDSIVVVTMETHHFATWLANCSVGGESLETKLANARLIAAAPELLEACQKLVEWDAREKDHAISFRERIDLCDEAFKLMYAAIAKATGGAA